MKHFPCNLCGSDRRSLVLKVHVNDRTLRYFFYARNVPNPEVMTGSFDVVKCLDCGLLRVDPRFETPELKIVYSGDKVTGGNWWGLPEVLYGRRCPNDTSPPDPAKAMQMVKAFSYNADVVEQFCQADGALRVLDIGCGKGFFLKVMSDRGHQVTGVDLSPERIQFARDVYGLQDVHNLDFSQLVDHLCPGSFDAITLWDVIEHVEEPLTLVQCIKPFLKPDGYLFIHTMTLDSLTYKVFRGRWYYVFPAQHLFYFSNDTMRQLFERAGYAYIGYRADNTAMVWEAPKALVKGIMAHTIFSLYRRESRKVSVFLHLIGFILNWPSRETGLKRMERLVPYLFPLRYRDCNTFIGRKTVKD